MTFYDYRRSAILADADEPFDALVMAAMRRADTDNARTLAAAFPHLWDELRTRYNTPGGLLPGETPPNPRCDCGHPQGEHWHKADGRPAGCGVDDCRCQRFEQAGKPVRR